ncbi:MAG: LuxR family transcriptional regulator [Alphaproteobacteria bacterium CG1_02_46_17]|nr:MAG: LuxR family transcriptional regulator [Alphaproteobacteria bacterium CG1_02_46_17]
MWIDSHCHLNHSKFTPEGGVGEALAAAHAVGVDGMLSIDCLIREEFDGLLQLVKPLENVWCTVGTHPHDAGREDEKTVSLEELISLAKSDDKVVGIGECGLDYYYNKSSIEDQQECFRKHIRACLETDMPMIVHARDADDDIIRIIRDETSGKGMRGVMHCFSSSTKMGHEAIDLGFHISFSGILTFKKSEDLRDFAKDVPLDRLLVETDSPYLAPEPFRGKMNHPALVVYTGEVLANLKSVPIQEMAKITSENFFSLFNKAKLTV